MPTARRTTTSSRAWARRRCGRIIWRTAPDGSNLRRWRGTGRLQFAHLLAIEADEIHRVEQQGRETAIAHRSGDDLARERKQQTRAFDQHDRVQAFRGNV